MTTENEIKPAAPAEAIDGGRCAVDAGFGVWVPTTERLPANPEGFPRNDHVPCLCAWRGWLLDGNRLAALTKSERVRERIAKARAAKAQADAEKLQRTLL